MTRFVVIATMRRGAVDPPELLSKANRYRMSVMAQEEEARRSATLKVQCERDPKPTMQEIVQMKKSVESGESEIEIVCTLLARIGAARR